MAAAIEYKNISKSYGSNVVLKDFSLTLEKGEFITIIGSSGCGKTTILKMVNGLISPDSGDILINGRSIRNQDVYKRQGVDLSGHKGSSFSAEINENAISLLEKFYSLDKSGQDVVMMVLDREIENIKKIKEQATQISELQKAILPCYMITYYQTVSYTHLEK